MARLQNQDPTPSQHHQVICTSQFTLNHFILFRRISTW